MTVIKRLPRMAFADESLLDRDPVIGKLKCGRVPQTLFYVAHLQQFYQALSLSACQLFTTFLDLFFPRMSQNP